MRELPLGESDAVMAAVRAYLGDKKKNPFMFNDVEKARILSGEEEGAYGWIAINYLKGALKDDIDKGTKGGEGGVAAASVTYGAVEMGGASTQISFFKTKQNIVADLYKLQIGGTNTHWNIYTHSFLG
jgi:Golgi nucleoside diphosphatase